MLYSISIHTMAGVWQHATVTNNYSFVTQMGVLVFVHSLCMHLLIHRMTCSVLQSLNQGTHQQMRWITRSKPKPHRLQDSGFTSHLSVSHLVQALSAGYKEPQVQKDGQAGMHANSHLHTKLLELDGHRFNSRLHRGGWLLLALIRHCELSGNTHVSPFASSALFLSQLT